MLIFSYLLVLQNMIFQQELRWIKLALIPNPNFILQL